VGELPDPVDPVTRQEQRLLLDRLVQLHLRASARKPPPDGTARDYLLFLRLELARQQHALHTVWRWCLLPFVPGMLVIYAAMAQEQDGSSWLLGLGAFAALLAVGHYLTRVAAKRLGRRLASLAAALGE
jgi:hypothetical protein